jgi:predicted RNase H-like HicB family nuclease
MYMKYKVIIHKAEEGGYWAEVPALPGCFSQGETLEEVRANIKEAIEAYIESQEKDLLELKKTDRVITVEV